LLFAAPDKTIAAALFMAAVAALGWLAANVITTRHEENDRRVTWELDYISKQLKLLYGPLYFQIKEGGAAWTQFQTIFRHLYGRDSPFVITNGKDPGDPDEEVRPLTDNEWNTWITWTEKEFVPRNREIAKILKGRADLIEGWAGLSSSYDGFLKHFEAFEANWRNWQATHRMELWRPGPNWPKSFETDVSITFVCLKQRQAALGGVLRNGSQEGQTVAGCRRMAEANSQALRANSIGRQLCRFQGIDPRHAVAPVGRLD
jgi:hypothetical protein